MKDEDLPPADKKADGIAVVDATTGRFLEKIDSGSDPEQFSLCNDERSSTSPTRTKARPASSTSPAKAVVATLKVGIEPEGVTTTPDGRAVYVTSETTSEVHVLDTATPPRSSASFKTAQRPRGVAFLPDGSKAYVTCETAGVIDVVDAAILQVPSRSSPTGRTSARWASSSPPTAAGPTSPPAAAARSSRSTPRPTRSPRTVPYVGARPWGIGITPDGQTLYTANGPSNDVSVIDVPTLTVKGRIKAGESPWGIAIGR